MARYAFFRFRELPVGDLLCDGEAEARFSGEVTYAAATCVYDASGYPRLADIPEVLIIDALEAERRQQILDAIEDARAYP